MATEEPIAAAAAAAAPTTPPTLPHYPELILAAIEAVDDKNGANKSTISRQIEATYGNLPAGHTTLLSHHLNKMKQSGQLIMLKNNYLKPDPNAPPRRGRGRPPKPKSETATPQDYVVSPSRPRGRPPKPVDPLSPPPEKKTPAVSGRKRGRPPKTVKTTAAAATTKEAPPSGAPRGRGRPPKVKPGVTAPVGA